MRGRRGGGHWFAAYTVFALVLAIAGAIKGSTDYVLAALVCWQWANIASLRSDIERELDHVHRRIDIIADAQNERQEGGSDGS